MEKRPLLIDQTPMELQRAVPRAIEGTATAMVQGGLPEEWMGLRDGTFLPLAERARQVG